MELKNARQRGSLLEAEAVEREWGDILRTVRAGMLALPSRVAQRLPHLTAHDVSEIDAEVRAVLAEIGTSQGNGRFWGVWRTLLDIGAEWLGSEWPEADIACAAQHKCSAGRRAGARQ